MISDNQKKQIEDNRINAIIEQRVKTTLPCTIKEYNAEKNTVTVKPFGGLLIYGEFVEYPEINNIPVISFQSNGGKAGLSQSYKAGDFGLVLFIQNGYKEFIDKMQENKDNTEYIMPMFRYSDAVFLGGLYPSKEKNEDLSDEAMTVYNENAKVEVLPNIVKISPRNGKNKVEVGKNYAQMKMGNNEYFINEKYSQIKVNNNRLLINDEQIVLQAKNGKYINFNGSQAYITTDVGINGDLYVMGDIKLSGTVDGVDVSRHQHIWRFNGNNNYTSSPV